MGYKPTLGGIRALQYYLSKTKYAMPIFRTDVYFDGQKALFGWTAGSGRVVNLNKLIKEEGERKEIVDCKIESVSGEYALQFSAIHHKGLCTMESAIEDGYDVTIEHTNNFEMTDLMNKKGNILLNIAKYGRERPRLVDRLKWITHFYEFPPILPKSDSRLVYCATPSRFAKRKDEICKYVVEKNEGFLPFHPFFAFPYEFFEGHPNVGRENAMKICLRAVEDCDDFWMFGVSKGTLEEVVHAKQLKKPIRLIKDFDNDWDKYYAELGSKYGNPLEDIK